MKELMEFVQSLIGNLLTSFMLCSANFIENINIISNQYFNRLGSCLDSLEGYLESFTLKVDVSFVATRY